MRLINALKLILTLRCNQSSQLLSESFERELSLAERWAVRLHRLGCWSCRRLARQLAFLRHAARTAGAQETPGPIQLSEAARARIQARIERAMDS